MIFNDLKYYKTVVDQGALEESVAEVAFAGRSNVGKSSVINAVCNRRQIAHTSQVPGKTRTINVYTAGKGVWLVDLPGYGYASGPVEERNTWPAMIEGYLLGRKNLRMVYVIVDAKVGPTKLDRQMLDWIQSQGLPFAVVANKADKLKSGAEETQRKAVAEGLGLLPEEIYWVSAQRGTGIQVLAHAMAELLK